MNTSRRKKITKASALLDEACRILEEVRDEEQDSFYNLPEGLQMSEKGYDMEDNISSLEDSIGSISDASFSIDEFVIRKTSSK